MTQKLGFIQWFNHGDRAHVERALRQLKELNVTHLRTGLSWADWHRPDGESWFDWYVPRLAKEVDLVPCFSYTPPSLGVVPRTSSPPREPSRYAGFVAQMTERYSEHFEWVELWNEPNNRAEWDWTLDPEYRIFSAMVIEAAERAHERGKKVLLGGLSPIDPTFLAHLGKLGVLQHMDAVGLHGFPGTWERNWNGWAAEVERIVEVNEQFGVKPALWGTEIGFSTRKSRETEQVAVFMEAVEQPFDRLYWYTLEDLHPDLAANSGFHQDEREYHQGIIRVNGLPKLLHRLWREIGVEGIKRERWIVEEPTFAPGERPVVVTGGAGFVGTNLADRLLLEGQSVLIFDDLSRQGTLRNLRWLRARHGPRAKIQVASVLQERALAAAVARASAVFHLAAQVAVTTSLEHPDHDFAVNVQGTLNLLEAMRGLENPPPLVFSSTNKVYGDLAHVDMRIKGDRYVPEDPFIATRGIDESAPLRLYTPYGCSKGAAEQYILDYARMFNLPAVVFRMSCIYGPHQHGTEDQGWIAHFLIQAADEQPIAIYGDGRQVRDVLFVEDLVDAFLLAAKDAHRLKGRAFNIGGGPTNTLSLLELLRHIARLEGHPPTVVYGEARRGDQRYYVSDPTAFHRATGWTPRVGVREGLGRLHAWVQSARAAPRPLTPLAVGRRR